MKKLIKRYNGLCPSRFGDPIYGQFILIKIKEKDFRIFQIIPNTWNVVREVLGTECRNHLIHASRERWIKGVVK